MKKITPYTIGKLIWALKSDNDNIYSMYLDEIINYYKNIGEEDGAEFIKKINEGTFTEEELNKEVTGFEEIDKKCELLREKALSNAVCIKDKLFKWFPNIVCDSEINYHDGIEVSLIIVLINETVKEKQRHYCDSLYITAENEIYYYSDKGKKYIQGDKELKKWFNETFDFFCKYQ